MKTFIISAVLLSASVGYSFGGPAPDSMSESMVGSMGSSDYTVSSSTSSGCANVPSDVKRAFAETKAFSSACPAARLAPGKKIAINDYSPGGAAHMFIFDQNGACVGTIPISWGAGAGGQKEACSTTNSKMTPPGFHITAPHSGSRFNSSNSLGLASLSGQDSLGSRGILIHGVNYQTNRGNTWGCTGVPMQDFAEVQRILGYGSLVFNYFGGGGKSKCGESAGFAPPSCQPEPQAVAVSNSSLGGYSYSGAISNENSIRRGNSGKPKDPEKTKANQKRLAR